MAQREAQPTLKQLEHFARLGVRFMTPYKMLRIEQARFVPGTHT